MDRFRHIGGFGCSISESECGNHVAFRSCAYSGASSLGCLGFDFFPEVAFGAFYFFCLRIFVDFLEYGVDLFHLKIDDVVHDALCLGHMFAKQIEIEFSIVGEGILHI